MGGQRVCVRRVGREKEKNKTAARPLGVVFWLLAEEEMRQSYVVFVVLKVRLQRAHAPPWTCDCSARSRARRTRLRSALRQACACGWSIPIRPVHWNFFTAALNHWMESVSQGVSWWSWKATEREGWDARWKYALNGKLDSPRSSDQFALWW